MPSLWDVSRCCCTPPDPTCNNCGPCCCSNLYDNSDMKISFAFPCVSVEGRQAYLLPTNTGLASDECRRWLWTLTGWPYSLSTLTQCCVPMPPRAVRGINDMVLSCIKTPASNPCSSAGCTSSCMNFKLKIKWCDAANPYITYYPVSCTCNPLELIYHIAPPTFQVGAGGLRDCGCQGWTNPIIATVTEA